jgi:HSP20 family protein
MLTPFSAMDALFQGLTQLPSQESSDSVVRPRVDILEDESSYRLLMDLPGIEKDQLKVEVDNGQLNIEAARKEIEMEGFEARRLERLSSSHYRRSFTVGEEIEVEKASAEFHNGVLTLTLPKREKALPRRIEVR